MTNQDGVRLTDKVEETIGLLEQEAEREFEGDFLKAFVRSAARSLGVRYAFVMKSVGDPPTQARVLGTWMGEDFGISFAYDLVHTPCEGVLQGNACAYVRDVQQQFPKDGDLVTLDAQAYLGVPLRDLTGHVVGHIAVMHTAPVDNADDALALLGRYNDRLAKAIME